MEEINKNFEISGDSNGNLKNELLKEINSSLELVEKFKKNFGENSEEYKNIYKEYSNILALIGAGEKLITRSSNIELASLNDELKDLKLNNENSDLYKILKIIDKIKGIFYNKFGVNISSLNNIDIFILPKEQKESIFFQMKFDAKYIFNINNKNLIVEFFSFMKGDLKGDYFKFLNGQLKEDKDIVESFLENSSEANLNIIPKSFFEETKNIEYIINDISSYKSIDTQKDILKQLFAKLSNNLLIKKSIDLIIDNKYIQNEIKNDLWILLNPTLAKQFFPEKEIKVDNLNNEKNNANELLKGLNFGKTKVGIGEAIKKLDNILIKNPEIISAKEFSENLIKFISRNPGFFDNFLSIQYNKNIIEKIFEKTPSIIASISPDMIDKDIISIYSKLLKNNKNNIGLLPFISINSKEQLIILFNGIKNSGIELIEAFSINSFGADILRLTKNGENNELKEIKKIYEESENSFKLSFEGISNFIDGKNKEKIISLIEKEVGNENAKKVVEIIIGNKDPIKLKGKYSELIKLCKNKKEIFFDIIKIIKEEQSNIYQNKEEIQSSIDKKMYDLGIKFKQSWKNEKYNLIELVKEIENEKGEKIVSVDQEKVLNIFIKFAKKQENKTQIEIIKNFFENLGLGGNNLGLEEVQIKEMIGGIIIFKYEGTEKAKTENNLAKNGIYQKFLNGKISNKKFLDEFNKDYSENLEKNFIQKDHSGKNLGQNGELDGSGFTININNYGNYNLVGKNGNIIIDGLNKDEAKLAGENEKVRENLIKFKESLDALGISKLWSSRNFIFKGIENKIGIKIFEKNSDFMNTKQLNLFLFYTLKSISSQLNENEKNELLNFEGNLEFEKLSIFIAKVNNSSDIITKSKEISNFGSKIETIFTKKFIDNGKFLQEEFYNNLK